MIRHGADEVFAGKDAMYTEEDIETLLAKGAKKVGGAGLPGGGGADKPLYITSRNVEPLYSGHRWDPPGCPV